MIGIPENKPCPKCRELGGDDDGDNLFLMNHGKGYVCRQNNLRHPPYYEWLDDPLEEAIEYVHSPTEARDKVMNGMTLDEVQKLPVAALKARGIDKDIAERYGVRVEYDTGTGEEKAYYYPISEGSRAITYRKRQLPKSFSNVGESIKGRKVELFGQSTCQKGGKKLLICGGQDDMLAASQMLVRKYPNYPPNVVSLTNGENTKSVADNLDFINSYEEVLIYTDMDEVGRKCAGDIAKLIGPKAKLVETSEKDANDMLRNGKSAEFINAFFSAKGYIPDGILTVADVRDEAIKMPQWGRRWPWPSLDGFTYGRRDGEGIFVGAAVKAGKTEWLSQMVNYITETEAKKVFLAKFEQDPAQTVKATAGKIAHKQFHKPDGDFTQQELIEAVDKLDGKLIMFDASFSDVGHSNMWDRLKPAIRHAVLVEGVKDVFIDPITQLTDGLTPTETETELRRFSNELAGMAKDLGFFYYCFAHLKAPETGKTHEEGAQVKVAQFRGSRAMAEKTKYMLGIMRNQWAEDEVERNTSTFHLLLNSGFGKTGRFDVFYDEATGDYLEPVNDFKGEY